MPIPVLIQHLIQNLADQHHLSSSELESLWTSTFSDHVHSHWNTEKHQQLSIYQSTSFYELKEDIVLRYGEEQPIHKSKMAIFYLSSLIQPKEGKKYFDGPHDWEWSVPELAKDVTGYLEDDSYHLVLIANEVLSWKVEMLMHVAHQLLPANGKMTVLIGVRHPFPLPTLFERTYPSLKWKEALVIGSTPEEVYLSSSLHTNWAYSTSYVEEKQ